MKESGPNVVNGVSLNTPEDKRMKINGGFVRSVMKQVAECEAFDGEVRRI